MAKETRVYYIKDKDGQFFRGRLGGDDKPICDGCMREAMKMTPLDIRKEFPDGLPIGWRKEKALY